MLPALPVEEKLDVRGPAMAATASVQNKPAEPKPAQSKSAQKSAGRSAAKAAAAAKADALPVREGEEHWTVGELADVRTRLSAEIEEFAAEIRAALNQAAEHGDSGEGAGDDQADAGAKTYEREHELALTNNCRDLLEQNERAIARIDAGTYGVCDNCGQAIGKARLQAFPRATLCVPCKQREERR